MAEKKDYITDFDSSTSMLFALSHHLKGEGFDGAGIAPPVPALVGDWINTIPQKLRLHLYRVSGWLGAVRESTFKKVDSEDIAAWIVRQYPRRQYPAVMIGSANGSAMHLAAALGIPWIPQTTLLSGRRNLHPDEIEKDIEWGRRMVKHFLPDNPDLRVRQMHDPLQDRLMISKMGYFRLKRLRLGKCLETFLDECLAPGGTILTVENDYAWPVYEAGERHTFQIGGHGGLRPREYLDGSPMVDCFLASCRAKVRKWGLPRETVSGAEAEWGFEPELLDDVRRYAAARGAAVWRMRFEDPEAFSPLAADLYRWWYARLGRRVNALLVESFALLEPYWAIQMGLIPFWLTFNTESSSAFLEKYLHQSGEWDEIFMMLMSNGVPNAVGLTPIPEWRRIMSRARKRYDFIGVEEAKYPVDFATFLRYERDLKEKVKCRYENPEPLTLQELKLFLAEHGKNYTVEWHHEKARAVPQKT